MPERPAVEHAAAEDELSSADGLGPASARLEMAEMHHRFANVLQSVRGLLRRQARAADGAGGSDAFERADAQLHAFGLLHERLRRTDAGDGSPRPCCAGYLADVCAALSDACLAPRGYAISYCARPPLPLPERTCRQLGLLVTELVLNASKHAFAGRGHGLVTVEFALTDGGGMRLVVADDGVGLGTGGTAGAGQGLRFVEMLARSVGARCVVSTGSAGTRYDFEVDDLPTVATSVGEVVAEACEG